MNLMLSLTAVITLEQIPNCTFYQKSADFGAIHRFQGDGVFNQKKLAHATGAFPDPPDAGTILIVQAGVIGVLPGVVSIQATEAIKVLLDLGKL